MSAREREEIAIRAGLPAKMGDRLVGDTADELLADARTLAAAILRAGNSRDLAGKADPVAGRVVTARADGARRALAALL